MIIGKNLERAGARSFILRFYIVRQKSHRKKGKILEPVEKKTLSWISEEKEGIRQRLIRFKRRRTHTRAYTTKVK